MNPGLVVKLRPTGPWRSGPDSGARNRVDPIYHSDSLYAAVTAAMARMGGLEEWLDATARNAAGPAVCFSSCFPFLDEVGFIVPPRNIWPPLVGSPVAAAKVRWRSAKFIPLGLVSALLAGQVLDDEHWIVDGLSECLLPIGRPGPFRVAVHGNAAVDRMSGATERHSTACIEFRPGAGLWAIVSFAGREQQERWSGPVKAALRLLADSGFGGERSRGWGRSEEPEFVEGVLPDMVLPPASAAAAVPETPAPEPVLEAAAPTPAPAETTEAPAESSDSGTEVPPADAVPAPVPVSVPAPTPVPAVVPAPAPVAAPAETAAESGPTAHWLLSLFTPGAGDAVDWHKGNYATTTRGGRVDSPAGSGALKKQIQMVTEGSVLYAEEEIRGAATDVAPDGFAHPVFRVGFALAIPLPPQVTP